GKVYLAVPFGPPILAPNDVDGQLRPVWQLDAHDIRDMIGEKPDLTIDSLYSGDDLLTGEPQGWWIATYTADHRPVPPVDMARHLWLQRPKQTVSAAIIAGPNAEELFHWTLRS